MNRKLINKVKKCILLGMVAMGCAISGTAGATSYIQSNGIENFHPSALGNYEKGSSPIGSILAPGTGYNSKDIIPLSMGNVESSEGIQMESTGYSPYETSGYTATGEYVRYGIAAVDTNVIPLGTSLYVEGYGNALAADTGEAIQGNRIDLAFNSYQDALNWGRRDVMVYQV